MFTPLFSQLQGSSLKDKTCGRSQRFPSESKTVVLCSPGHRRRDRTCVTSAASSRDSSSSSAWPAQTALPGQGKHWLCLHLPGVCCHMSRRGASFPGDGEPCSAAGCTGSSPCWRGAGKRVCRVLLGQPGLSSPSLLFICFVTKEKNLSEENPASFSSMQGAQRHSGHFVLCSLGCCGGCGPWSRKPRSGSSSDSPSLCGKCVQNGVLDPSTDWETQLSPHWVRESPELGAPVSSPAKRSLSSTPTPHIQLTSSAKFVFTLKYTPLALDLLHSGRD